MPSLLQSPSSHSSGVPFALQSSLVPSAISIASSIPLPLQSGSHESGTPFPLMSWLVPSLISVESLLARLEKPYRYDLQSVYFDLLKNDWEYQLRIPEVEEQIEELIGNEENDVLLEIKDRIEEYLDGLDENEERE